ncbi:hypothetical protein BDV28DRAFT_61096 [Aspergillus coremiiformis]|uniref:Uncharacterized protein n=1 Tax=Aspergillus coremiiformis TaxID=138285 RepID=A0A5N6Z0F4_9EURO|nr:hypothetical protein BDV28DRAFT_61096 [Aspergillus coremiiformis]
MGVKSRKSSFSTKSDSESPTRLSINSAIASAFQSPSILSPISPTGFATPSPLSPTQSQENFRPDNLSDLLGDYQSTHTKSTISIDTTSSISAGVTSPSSTLLTDSPFTPASQSRNSSTDSNLNRPRSQTFPFMGVDPSVMSPDGHPDQLSPKTGLQQATLQESPLMDDPDPKAIPNLDTSFSTIKRNRSNSEIKAKSIYPPLFPKSATTSPVSSPVSPTQDEARRALELVLNYFEHQPTGLGAQDYMYIGKLMERLELAQTQHTQQTALPGGLHRIDEHDDGPNLHKKRSIRSLG